MDYAGFLFFKKLPKNKYPNKPPYGTLMYHVPLIMHPPDEQPTK
jgi:hypothetical protein